MEISARRPASKRDDGWLRWSRSLALAAALSTYCLIVLGSTVRVTNSGMGCSGWPLCSGQIGPIAQFHPLMEQSHRYLASLVTVLIVALAVLTWRSGAKARYMRGPAIATVALIAVQIALGAITVFTNNAPATVALHLAVGLLFLAIVTVAAVVSFTGDKRSRSWLHEPSRLAWSGLVGLFFVLVSGSLVVDGGAQAACESWPACLGSRAPTGLVVLQLIHRSTVLVGATLVTFYLVRRLCNNTTPRHQRLLAWSALTLLAAQIALGGLDALLGAPPALADAHLALASALWAVVVAVVALTPEAVAVPQRSQRQPTGHLN